MALYRKIDVRIWNDSKFRALSPYGKLAFVFLLTHPNMTAIGAMRASVEGLSAELRVPSEAFWEVFVEASREALPERCRKGASSLAIFDPEACCVFIPNFVKYQSAESPNVVKAWARTLEYIPECSLKTLAIQGVQAFVEGMSEGFRKAFRETFGEVLGEDIQESVSSKQRAVRKHPSQGGDIVSTTKIGEIGGAAQTIGNGGDDDF